MFTFVHLLRAFKKTLKNFMEIFCGNNSSDRTARLSNVFLIQINPLYLQGGSGDICQHRTLSDELGVIPLSKQVFISWASESLLTAVASKLQFRNLRHLKYRAENSPVL